MENTGTGIRRIALSMIVVIVLFIVLSTATYAWYTTNNLVRAENIVFTSSSRDAQGGLLSIGTSKTSEESSITFDRVDMFYPMIPITECLVGETTYGDFVTGFNKTAEGGDPLNPIAKVDGEAIDPVTLEAGGQKVFYVINRDVDDMTVSIAYAFDEGEGSNLKDKLHIAVFKGEDLNATLLGVASLSEIHYGAIRMGEAVASTPVVREGVKKDTGEMTFTLASGEAEAFRLVVWLDGVAMKDENGAKNMLFGITFNRE